MNNENVALTSEIEFWLFLSATFFEIFHIEKDPGPTWFLVNELLKHPERSCTVGIAAEGLQDRGVARTKPTSDVSKYARHLEDIGLLKIERPDLWKGRVFPVTTLLIPTVKMKTAVGSYIRRVLRKLYDPATADQVNDQAAHYIMKQVYDFMIETYIHEWEVFLKQIARISVRGTTGSDGPVAGRLQGSSEFFVLLLKLWETRLNGDDKLGFTIDELQHLHPRVLATPQNTMLERIHFLEKIQVVSNIAEKQERQARYSLVDKFVPAFEQYAPKFVTMRGALREYLQLRIPAKELLPDTDKAVNSA